MIDLWQIHCTFMAPSPKNYFKTVIVVNHICIYLFGVSFFFSFDFIFIDIFFKKINFLVFFLLIKKCGYKELSNHPFKPTANHYLN